jgi:glycosyltransferase involved in cell wall biosynthesis
MDHLCHRVLLSKINAEYDVFPLNSPWDTMKDRFEMTTLTAIILTYNEEQNLGRCLESLKKAGARMIIVDSFSTDSTLEIARSYGSEIYQNEWVNYAVQFQWALDHCALSSDWVMRIDADEYLEDEMISLLLPTLTETPNDVTALDIKLWNCFLGHKMKFGGYDPLVLTRLWRRGQVEIENRWMDEHLILLSGKIGHFRNGGLLHENLKNNTWWVEKHNAYANREMIDIITAKYGLRQQKGEEHKLSGNISVYCKRWLKNCIYGKLPLFVRPTLYFVYRYILFFGFLDGKHGFAYHFLQAYWYRALVDVRVLEIENILKNKGISTQNVLDAIHRVSGIRIDSNDLNQ